KKSLFTHLSMLECLDYRKVVHVGTAGHKNLEAHRMSKACRIQCCKLTDASGPQSEKANQVIESFFKPRAPLNPSTVSAPPPIWPSAYDSPQELTKQASMPKGQSAATQLSKQHTLDKKAVSLLQDLEAAVKQIPCDVPSATPEHQLSIFAVDP
ncbi:hypothetical protein EDB89DRAFT_1814620, partial [Lactarius sanguifluus]